MSGKGRGRGRGSTVSTSPSVKPGNGGAPKDPMDQLNAMVNSLTLDADDKELLPIRETASKANTSQEKMEEVFKNVYQRCMEDWRFSSTAAKVCCAFVSSGLEAEGVKFRTMMLTNVQTDFKNKDKLRIETPKKFLGVLAFMCNIYALMRDEKGEVFKPMTSNIMEAVEILLDSQASDDEMSCAAVLLTVVGKTLQQNSEKIRMTSLRNKVKDKIIHAVGSKDVRTELIKVVEGFASDWRHYS